LAKRAHEWADRIAGRGATEVSDHPHRLLLRTGADLAPGRDNDPIEPRRKGWAKDRLPPRLRRSGDSLGPRPGSGGSCPFADPRAEVEQIRRSFHTYYETLFTVFSSRCSHRILWWSDRRLHLGL
jgi:hypothetical protein